MGTPSLIGTGTGKEKVEFYDWELTGQEQFFFCLKRKGFKGQGR